MLALLQRVTYASVQINNETTAEVKQGLLILCGFKIDDTLEHCLQLLKRCFNYRIFTDHQDKMNLSLKDISGEALIVPQFTLVADTKRGLRPSFSKGMPPQDGHNLFEKLRVAVQTIYPHLKFGCFAADMKINLCNDGPVTFLLEN